MLVAAGVAYYAMTAIFPAIATFVSIHGLFVDPDAVQKRIAGLSSLSPAASLKLLTDALQNFASRAAPPLTWRFWCPWGLPFGAQRRGVLLDDLNIASETTEKRGFIVQQVVALALTLGAISFAIVAISTVAPLPAITDFLP